MPISTLRVVQDVFVSRSKVMTIKHVCRLCTKLKPMNYVSKLMVCNMSISLLKIKVIKYVFMWSSKFSTQGSKIWAYVRFKSKGYKICLCVKIINDKNDPCHVHWNSISQTHKIKGHLVLQDNSSEGLDIVGDCRPLSFSFLFTTHGMFPFFQI